MSVSGSAVKLQLLNKIGELEASLANAKSTYDQWLAASGSNPTGLTRKDIDNLTIVFQRRVLTVKWDCEDLEDLIVTNDKRKSSLEYVDTLQEAKLFLVESREQMEKYNNHLEDFKTGQLMLSRHGISTMQRQQTSSIGIESLEINNIKARDHSETSDVNTPAMDIISRNDSGVISEPQQKTVITNPMNDMTDDTIVTTTTIPDPMAQTEIQHFDKSQIERSTSIFSNALYEHYEDQEDRLIESNGSIVNGNSATRMFNNLTRPNNTDVYMDSNNENEMILEMLETDYYNTQQVNNANGFLGKSTALAVSYNQTLRKLFETDQRKFLVCLLTLPLMLVMFLVL